MKLNNRPNGSKIRKGDLSGKPLVFIRKAQVTIFIIIALVIAFSVAGYYAITNSTQDDLTSNIDDKTAVLVTAILDCFDQVYINSLTVAGFQGGYTKVENGLYNGFVILPYYYNEGNLNIPTINTIETEIENYLDLTLSYCLNYKEPIVFSEELGINVSFFDLLDDNYNGYNLDYKTHKTKVKIENSKVIFTTNLDLSISKIEGDTVTIDFSKHPKEITSDIYNMHEIASYISNSLATNNQAICLTCVNDLAEEKDLSVEIINYANPEDELVIISNNITSVPIIFQYLNKYSDLEENENN